jgi:hypothetical protein
MVSMLASSPERVKPKTIKLVFVASMPQRVINRIIILKTKIYSDVYFNLSFDRDFVLPPSIQLCLLSLCQF